MYAYAFITDVKLYSGLVSCLARRNIGRVANFLVNDS